MQTICTLLQSFSILPDITQNFLEKYQQIAKKKAGNLPPMPRARASDAQIITITCIVLSSTRSQTFRQDHGRVRYPEHPFKPSAF